MRSDGRLAVFQTSGPGFPLKACKRASQRFWPPIAGEAPWKRGRDAWAQDVFSQSLPIAMLDTDIDGRISSLSATGGGFLHLLGGHLPVGKLVSGSVSRNPAKDPRNSTIAEISAATGRVQPDLHETRIKLDEQTVADFLNHSGVICGALYRSIGATTKDCCIPLSKAFVIDWPR